MDRCSHHCLTCAIGEATRGHTKIRDRFTDLAVMADPAAESESVSLTPRPGLRPADVLCSAAARGGLAALDVGVTMPTDSHGNVDAAQAHADMKMRKYRRYLHEMEPQGIMYKPIIWTAWGRAHPDVVAVLRSLATRAARRRGLASPSELLSQARRNIAMELQARAARMVLACLPTQEDMDEEEEDANQGVSQ